MPQLSKSFSILLQLFGAALLALLPLVLEKIVGSPARFSFFLETKEIYNLIIITLLLFFSFQILRLSKIIFRFLTASAFLSVYQLRKRNLYPLLCYLIGSLTISFGTASVVHGIVVYGYQIFQTTKNESEINRQYLIQKANQHEGDLGFGGSTPILKQIMSAFPNDERNDAIEIRLSTLDSARKTSTFFEKVGSRLEQEQKYLLASNSYKTALHIWPKNQIAKQKKIQLENEFISTRDGRESLYLACQNFDEMAITKNSAVLGYFVEEPEIVDLLRTSSTKIHLRKQVLDKICKVPQNSETLSEFEHEIKEMLGLI